MEAILSIQMAVGRANAAVSAARASRCCPRSASAMAAERASSTYHDGWVRNGLCHVGASGGCGGDGASGGGRGGAGGEGGSGGGGEGEGHTCRSPASPQHMRQSLQECSWHAAAHPRAPGQWTPEHSAETAGCWHAIRSEITSVSLITAQQQSKAF